MTDESGGREQQLLGEGRLPRIVFQGNAAAFVIFAWLHRDNTEVAMISLGFGAFMLVCWGVLFATHLRTKYGGDSAAV